MLLLVFFWQFSTVNAAFFFMYSMAFVFLAQCGNGDLFIVLSACFVTLVP